MTTKDTDFLKGLKVVDTDAHWIEAPDLWTSRAPAKYKNRVPHRELVDGKSVWYVKGDVEFGTTTGVVIDAKGEKHNAYGVEHMGMMSIPSFEETNKAVWDPRARVDYMEAHGIWAEMLFPQSAGFSAARFMSTFADDPDLELTCIKIYNDAMADLQRDGQGRLFPFAMIPVRNMNEAVKEMRRCVEDLKLTGYVVSDNLAALGLPDYQHPYWDQYWECLNALDVPINFHTGGTLLDATKAPWKYYTGGEKLAMNTTAANMTNAAAMANIMLSGIHDRYPKVRMASVESGIGWVPYFLETLDHNVKSMIPEQMRRIQRLPSEYFKDHWWACFWFEEAALQHQLNDLGVEKALFETDYPHPTCLYPDNEEWVARTARGLDEYTMRRIFQDNAFELYKLPMPVTSK